MKATRKRARGIHDVDARSVDTEQVITRVAQHAIELAHYGQVLRALCDTLNASDVVPVDDRLRIASALAFALRGELEYEHLRFARFASELALVSVPVSSRVC